MSRLTHETAFDLAHAHVAKWEGGFFDHPSDPGGVTMYGVSLMFLKSLNLIEGDIDGDGDIDRDDVLKITKDKARAIFKRHFWEKPRAAELPPLVAVAFYDFAVPEGRQLDLCLAYLDRRKDWYRRLAKAKPTSAAFLRGWLNRTADCRALVTRTAHEWGVE